MGFLDNYESFREEQSAIDSVKEVEKQEILDSISNISRIDENLQWMAESTNVNPDMIPIIEGIGEKLKGNVVSASGEAQTAHDLFVKRYDNFQADISTYKDLENQASILEEKVESANQIAFPTIGEKMFGSNDPIAEKNYWDIYGEHKKLRIEMEKIKDHWYDVPEGYDRGTPGTFTYPGTDKPTDRRTEFQKLEDLHSNAQLQAKKADTLRSKYITDYNVPSILQDDDIPKEEDLLFEYDDTMDEAFFKATTGF